MAASRRIVATRRASESATALASRAAQREPRGVAFREAVARTGRINVIAECKRRSPARGVLRRDYKPGDIARAYEEGGASAVSVLTEPTFFDGSLTHLEEVRAAVALPILRKDFIIDEYQLLEARAAGADAVLLIVAACVPSELTALVEAARTMGLAALVEAHTADEIRQGIDAGATIIGVNSRNLNTLAVDLGACDALVGEIPPGCVAVAESGIRSLEDVRHLHAIGYQAVLIGEWLMSAGDPCSTLQTVVGMAGAATLERGDPCACKCAMTREVQVLSRQTLSGLKPTITAPPRGGVGSYR
ncbi:MAG: indole-3-glycerol phosphate synthase TrpC, partial [Acidobacteria bacterium]|nr:indole-3-glycerol phosphate synthase TrpC [Acidobacteriota bacterium]